MANTPALTVELLGSDNTWYDITGDVMGVEPDIGLAGRHQNKPKVGTCTVLLKNKSRAYNPNNLVPAAAAPEILRRVRVRATGASLGKCLRFTHNGAYGNGGSTPITATGLNLPIGNNGGTTYRQAQSFLVPPGQLTQITFQLAANVGTPTGTMTWEIRNNNSIYPGGTVPVTASGQLLGIGNVAGIIQRFAESFVAVGGRLTSFSFDLGANNGAPTGGLTWEIRSDNAKFGPIGSVLATGTIATPTASATNTVTLTTGPVLNTNQKYWLVIYATTPAASGNYWQWQAQAAGTYYNGNVYKSIDLSVSWGLQSGYNAQCSFTTVGLGPGSTVVDSGTLTPTASATNTINTANGGVLLLNARYWLVLYSTGAQTSGNYWQWQAQSTSTYVDGNTANSTDAGSNWTQQPSQDAQCTITSGNIGNNFRHADTAVTVNIGDTWILEWDARAQFDSQYNQDDVTISNGAEISPHPIFTYTNKWQHYTSSFTFSIGGPLIRPVFKPYYVGNGSNSTFVEYRNITLKKTGGANVLTNSDFSNGFTDWILTNNTTPPVTNTQSVVADTWFEFNGVIDSIVPSPFQNAGDFQVALRCLDFVSILQNATIQAVLQKNQIMPQLFNTLMAQLPSGTFDTTLPSSMQTVVLGTTAQVFGRAFDAYQANKTTLFDAFLDLAASEYSRFWIDADGTLRLPSRGGPDSVTAIAESATPALTLQGAAAGTPGAAFTMRLEDSTYTLANKIDVTYRPRQTSGSVQPIGQLQGILTLAPGSPTNPSFTTATITYRDSTGKVIGGDEVVTPVPGTDFRVWEGAAEGSGYDYTLTGVAYITQVVISASQISITFANNATGSLFVTFLQVRGKPIYTYDNTTITVQDPLLLQTPKTKFVYQQSFDLPFSNDNVLAQNIAAYMYNQKKNPVTEVTEVSVDNLERLNGVDLLSIGLMDVFSISDVQLGLTNAKHIVTGRRLILDPEGAAGIVKKVVFSVERIDQQKYWLLGVAGYGELGVATYLYV